MPPHNRAVYPVEADDPPTCPECRSDVRHVVKSTYTATRRFACGSTWVRLYGESPYLDRSTDCMVNTEDD